MAKPKKQASPFDSHSPDSEIQDIISGSRILFLVDELEAITARGTERQLLQMIDICKHGGMHPQVCIFRNTSWLTDEIAGCPVTHFQIGRLGSWKGVRSLMQLKRWIGEQKFDILQSFSSEANLVGPCVGRLAGVPVILGTRMSLNHASPDDPSPRSLRWQRRMNLLVNQIIASSEAVLEGIVESEKVSRKRICVVYNGVDLEQMRPSPELREAARKEFGLEDDHILVGNVSGLSKIKGSQMFVNAAADAYRRDPRLRFLLIGDGEMKTQLKQTIRMYGLDGVVGLHRPQKDVLPYLAALDIGVLCSYTEGFSNSLLEYMACGVPVIATDVGGNREALGPCGLLIRTEALDLANAIQLMSVPQTRKDYAAAALQKVRDFDVSIAREHMMEIYARYLAKGQSKKRQHTQIVPSIPAHSLKVDEVRDTEAA